MKRFLMFVLVGCFTLLLTLSVAAQTAITVGQTVEGELSPASPEATYQLSLQANQRVIITVISEDFDTVLTLKDAAGGEVAYNDDGGDALQWNSRLLFTAPQSATYTLVVTSFFPEESGSFTLSAQPLEALPLTFDAPQQVNFSPDNRVMYYSFDVEMNTILNIEIATGGSGLSLTFYSANGGVAPTIDISRDEAQAKLRAFLADGGNYTLVVEPYDEASGSFTFTVSEVQPISLDSGDVTLDLADSYSQRLTFTTQEGMFYRIIVSTVDFSVSDGITIVFDPDMAGDLNVFPTYIDGNSVVELSAIVQATKSGTIQIEISDFQGLTYNVSIEPIAPEG